MSVELSSSVNKFSVGNDSLSPLSSGGKQRPFLSVVVRTQGLRSATLQDVLLCLTAQSCDDFEIIVLAHRVEAERLAGIEAVVDSLAPFIRQRVSIVEVEREGRAAPLNVGFDRAAGDYVSILDDDDMVFAHWVETFKSLSSSNAGKVLRSCCVEQEVEESFWESRACSPAGKDVSANDHGVAGSLERGTSSATKRGASPLGELRDGERGLRTTGSLQATYPSSYDFFAHLHQNFTPVMCLAFPVAVFREHGLRFDEALSVCEDWDFGLRAVMACGIATSPEITSIYRKWSKGASSYTIHDTRQWKRDYDKIQTRIDSQANLFPPGSVKYIVGLQQRLKALEMKELWRPRRDWTKKLEPRRPAALRRLSKRVADELNLLIEFESSKNGTGLIARFVLWLFTVAAGIASIVANGFLSRWRQHRRRTRSVKLISDSVLFDGNFYLEQYPDVKAFMVNPIVDYVYFGCDLGRNPGPLFDNDWYRQQYPHCKDTAGNPLEHYLCWGAYEGCRPNRFFDSDFYLKANPDVYHSGVNPLWHYIHYGAAEGREPNSWFDTARYIKENPDIVSGRINPLVHFICTRAPRLPENWQEGDPLSSSEAVSERDFGNGDDPDERSGSAQQAVVDTVGDGTGVDMGTVAIQDQVCPAITDAASSEIPDTACSAIRPLSEADSVFRADKLYFEAEPLVRIAQEYRERYLEASPYPHIVFDGMIPEAVLEHILAVWPQPESQSWKNYNNYHEKKFETQGESKIDSYITWFLYQLNSGPFLEFLETLTGIDRLIPDPYFSGAGLHHIARGGKLSIHADSSKHDKLLLDRRVNVIIYLNKEWLEEYGGHLELWEKDMSGCARRVLPVFNRMLIFSLTDWAFHGHPEALTCPVDRNRKSLAVFYYTNGRPDGEVMDGKHNSLYLPRPGEVVKPSPFWRREYGGLIGEQLPTLEEALQAEQSNSNQRNGVIGDG